MRSVWNDQELKQRKVFYIWMVPCLFGISAWIVYFILEVIKALRSIMITTLSRRSLPYGLILLLLCSCGDGEAEGYYRLTKHQMTVDSCTGVEEAQTFSPDRVTRYFKLQYESFSLATYILSHCETDTFQQCETLYYFDPDDVNLLGSKLTIDEDKNCGENRHRIEAVFVKNL